MNGTSSRNKRTNAARSAYRRLLAMGVTLPYAKVVAAARKTGPMTSEKEWADLIVAELRGRGTD